jgi:hypothetical protein
MDGLTAVSNAVSLLNADVVLAPGIRKQSRFSYVQFVFLTCCIFNNLLCLAMTKPPRLRSRLLLGIAAAASGWMGGMLYLGIAQPWAFQTEFGTWGALSGLYSALLMPVITGWIARYRWHRLWKLVATTILQFAAAATVLPLCLFPVTGGISSVLLVTGQAYRIAAVAAMVYLCITITLRSGHIGD